MIKVWAECPRNLFHNYYNPLIDVEGTVGQKAKISLELLIESPGDHGIYNEL